MYPSYNRVYFESSKDLSISELKAANPRLKNPAGEIGLRNIAGVDYITFITQEALEQDDIEVLSRLSFVYALFEIQENGKTILFPVEKQAREYFEDDIVTILKYSGKTNETFTKMMINIGFLAGDYHQEKKISLLDPLSGRGTSLFQGLIYGWDVAGVEIDKKAVQQAVTFLTKYLQTKKIKHKLSQSKMSENGKKLCEIYDYELARTKEEFKGGASLKVRMVQGDTLDTPKFFKKESFHLIVADLPYGIQHGSSTPQGNLTRNPEELLSKAMPGWIKVLKPGGTVVLSWNTFVLKKQVIAEIMEKLGLKVLTDEPYAKGFVHRVDQAIMRDIIIGKK